MPYCVAFLDSTRLSCDGSNSWYCRLVISQVDIQKGRSIRTRPSGRSSAAPVALPITNSPAGIRTSSIFSPRPRSIVRRVTGPAACWRRTASAASKGQPGQRSAAVPTSASGLRLRPARAAVPLLYSPVPGPGRASGIVVQAGIALQQLAAALALRAGVLELLVPRAVERTVQIDPGDEPVPRLGVQLHAVVALA